jgi:RNA polymerase sigma-70 factor (ECF subfamily)
MAADEELLRSLRAGDERAFAELVERHSGALLRVARMYVSSEAVAQEVVQETWIGVIRGIDRFEGRSSLRTWIFRILTNIAKTRAQREGRSVPFSSLAKPAPEGDEPSVDPDRFFGPDGRNPGGWELAPTPLGVPEESLLSGEARDMILEQIEKLPPAQREVITLRDIEGWSSDEVADALEITGGNQRVLLHRARSKVRAALESYFNAMEPVS